MDFLDQCIKLKVCGDSWLKGQFFKFVTSLKLKNFNSPVTTANADKYFYSHVEVF